MSSGVLRAAQMEDRYRGCSSGSDEVQGLAQESKNLLTLSEPSHHQKPSRLPISTHFFFNFFICLALPKIPQPQCIFLPPQARTSCISQDSQGPPVSKPKLRVTSSFLLWFTTFSTNQGCNAKSLTSTAFPISNQSLCCVIASPET